MRRSLAVALALVLVGCSSAPASSPPPSGSPVVIASPTASPSPTPTPAPKTWPLTGLPLDGDATIRPIAVRFDNATPAQPQAGLGDADIVFDTVIEACVSRLLAIYHSKSPDPIGSVRSARLYDLQLLPLLRGALAHVGAADEVSQMLKDAAGRGEFVDVDAYKFGSYPAYSQHYWRVAHKGAPYNLYTSIASLRKAVASVPGATEPVTVPDWGFLPAEHGATDGGFEASVEATRFSFPGSGGQGCPQGQNVLGYRTEYAPTYTYDAAARGYRRAADGRPTIDETTKAAVLARNVVVIRSELAVTDIVESQGGWGVAYSIRPRTTGTGALEIYREGRRAEGTWTRASHEAAFEFTNAAGQRILLAPGQTWVHIVPADWKIG